MPKRERVTVSSYIKNVGKSFGYALGDTLEEYNPVLKNIHKQVKETKTELYSSIKEFKGSSLTDKVNTAYGSIKKEANTTWRNFKSDVRTGKFYNKERSSSNDDAMMKALGFDMDDFNFDFDDDWDDFEDDDLSQDTSSKVEINTGVQNTKAIIGSMDTVGASIANTVAGTTVESAAFLAENSNQNTKALYSLNQKGFNAMSTALLSVNNTIASFAQIGEPLTTHMQNSSVFFTKTTETLNQMNQTLQQIAKNTTPAKDNSNNDYRSATGTLSDIIDSDGVIDVSSYIDMVKNNFSDYKDIVDMAVGAVKSQKGRSFSLGTFITKYVTNAMIPAILKDSMKGFNEIVKNSITTGILKFKNGGSGNIVLELLKDFFVPEDGFKGKINTGNYEKGRVSWDGISRKALTEVIPEYLSGIYRVLSGEDKVYDYNRGRFITRKYVKEEIKNDQKRAAKEAGGDFRDDALDKIRENKKLSKEQKDQLEKEVEEYFYKAFMKNDGFYINSDDFNMSEFGLTKESLKILQEIIEENRKSKNIKNIGKTSGLARRIDEARTEYGDKKRREETSGTSNEVYTENGFYSESKVNNKKSKDLGTSKFDNTLMGYISGIYENTKFMADNITSFGSSKNNKTEKKNQPTGGEKTYEEARTDKKSDDEFEEIKEDDLDKIRQKEKDDRMKEAKDKLKDGKKSIIGRLRGLFKKDNLVGLYNRPFNAVANLLNGITVSLDKLLWGDDTVGDENGEHGIFGYLWKKTKSIFNKVNDYIDDKFKVNIKDKVKGFWDKLWGEKDENGKRQGGKFEDLRTETAEELKNAGKWMIGKNKPDQAAYGRKVTKDGIVAVSKGELIIPSELNPYYHGTTNKKQQIKNERNIIRRFFGSFAEGGTVGEDEEIPKDTKGETKKEKVENLANDFKDKLKEKSDDILGIVRRGFSEALWGRKKDENDPDDFEREGLVSFIKKATGKDDEKTDREAVNNATQEALKEVGDNKGAIAAGALIGGGVSLLTGAVVGPLFGAAIGGAVGMAVRSKKTQDWLFGEEDKNGERQGGKIKNKKIIDIIYKNVPSMAKGAGYGLVGGAFMGSPILGAIIGSTIGYVSSSENSKNRLFGTAIKDDKGNVIDRKNDGFISKDLQKKIKSAAPKMAIGTILGAAAGPFGLVGNMIFGAGLGYLSDSKSFHEYLFGDGKDDKGLAGMIKTKIVDQLDELFHNTGIAMKQWMKNTGRTLKNKFVNMINRRKKAYNSGEGKLLDKIIGGAATAGDKIVKGTIGKAGDAIGKANRWRKARNLNKGYNIYNKEKKRNSIASERLEERGPKGSGTAFELDKLMAGANKEELEELKKVVEQIQNPNSVAKRKVNQTFNNLYDELAEAGIDKSVAKQIGRRIDGENGLKRSLEIANYNLKGEDKEKVTDIINRRYKELDEARDTQKNTNAAIELAKSKYGINLSGKNAYNALDNINYELETRYGGEEGEKNETKEYRSKVTELLGSINTNIENYFKEKEAKKENGVNAIVGPDGNLIYTDSKKVESSLSDKAKGKDTSHVDEKVISENEFNKKVLEERTTGEKIQDGFYDVKDSAADFLKNAAGGAGYMAKEGLGIFGKILSAPFKIIGSIGKILGRFKSIWQNTKADDVNENKFYGGNNTGGIGGFLTKTGNRIKRSKKRLGKILAPKLSPLKYLPTVLKKDAKNFINNRNKSSNNEEETVPTAVSKGEQIVDSKAEGGTPGEKESFMDKLSNKIMNKQSSNGSMFNKVKEWKNNRAEKKAQKADSRSAMQKLGDKFSKIKERISKSRKSKSESSSSDDSDGDGNFIQPTVGGAIASAATGNSSGGSDTTGDGDKDPNTKTEMDAFGNIHRLVKNNDGQWTEANNDSDTNESKSKMNNFFSSVNTVPELAMLLTSINATLSQIAANGLGGKKKKKSNIFSSLFSKLFGGAKSGLSFLGSKVSSLLGKIPGKDLIGPALLVAALGGVFDKSANKLSKGAYGDKKQEKVLYTKDGKKVTKVTKNGKTYYIDSDGKKYNYDDLHYETGDTKSLSSKLKENIGRGLITGRSSIGSKVLKNNKTVNKIAKSVSKTASKVVNKETLSVVKDKLVSGMSKLISKLKKVPALKGVADKLDDAGNGIIQKVYEKLSNTSAKKISEVAGKVFLIARIAYVAIDFTSGYEDARTTLGITDEPTYAQKMISGLLRVMKNCIPVIGTFVPDSLIVNVLCDTIGPKLGISFKTLKKQRSKANNQVKEYNKKHGTNLTKQQYTKQVLKDRTWTERTSDTIKNTKKDTKKKFNDFTTGINTKGFGYFADTAKSLYKTFKSSATKEGGLIGISKGMNDAFAKLLPGVLGEIETVKGKIKSDANKGDVSAIWKESLSEFDGGKKEGDITTATPGIFSKIVGNIPLFLTKVTYTPMALFKATFNKIGGAFKSLFAPITNNIKAFNSGLKKLKKQAKNGSVTGVTKTKIKTKGFIGGVFKMMFGIAKGIYTLKASINKLLKPLNSLKEKIFGSSDSDDGDGNSGSGGSGNNNSSNGGLLSTLGNKVSSGISAVGTTLKGAASKASEGFRSLFFGKSDDKDSSKKSDSKKKDSKTDSKSSKKKDTDTKTTSKKSTKTSKKKSGGGSGLSGFVSQYNPKFNKYSVSGESFADKGCGPAVASMAASQFGKKLSVSDAVRSSKKYQNENGVSIDYFTDVLKKKNINTEFISRGSSGQIAQRLANGDKAILLGNDPFNQSKENSPFGPDNHYVLATGMDSDGNILVNDPESGEPRKYSSDILNHTEMAINASGGASGTKKKKSDSKKKDSKSKDTKTDSKSSKKKDSKKKKDKSENSTTEDPKFPTYKLSDKQIKGLANIVGHEQGGKAGRLAEASLMVNQVDMDGKKKTAADIVKNATGGWFRDGKSRYQNPGNPDKTAINAVKQVMVEGKRTLPRYVDEHDCFSDIKSVTTNGKSVNKTNRSAYKSHKSTIKNNMRSTYTFYSFPDKASDPFGYTSKAKRKKWGDAHYEGDQVVGSLGDGVDDSSSSDSNSSSGKSATILESIGNAFTSGFAKVFGGGDDSSSSGSSDSGDAGSTSAEGQGTAASFINIAKNEIGTKESPSGSNHVKYNKWYYGSQSGNPWCAAFVSWCMNQTFNGDTKTMKKVFRGPKAASVSDLYDRFRKAKAFTKTDPQPGDIVIYKNGTSHTGLVEKVNGKKVTTIEGNTSAKGFNSNGGCVAEKHITVGQPTRLSGFGRPNWDAAGGKGTTTDSKKKTEKSKSTSKKKTETKSKSTSKKSTKKKSGGGSGLSTPAKLLNQFNPSKLLYNNHGEGVVISKPNMSTHIHNTHRLSGGDSGLAEQTTTMLNDIKRSISENKTSGSIDSKVVEKLITAITGLLQSIASNTAPVQLIYDLLNSYLGNKNDNTNKTSETTNNQNNMTNKEVDENVKNLVGALAAIAKG